MRGHSKFADADEPPHSSFIDTRSKTMAKLGRPPKAVKEINPVRQVGRWTDSDWQLIRDAAASRGENVAEFAKAVLIRAAKRTVKA